MVSVKAVLKTIVLNVVFLSIATAQYYVLTEALAMFGMSVTLELIVYIVTLSKNYLILLLDEGYGSLFEKIGGEKREIPIPSYFGEFHVYMWIATFIETITAMFIVWLLPFSMELCCQNAHMYVLSWIMFFPIALIFEVVFDFFHYWAHRKSHYGFLYKHFHKIHHTYKAPTGIVSFINIP